MDRIRAVWFSVKCPCGDGEHPLWLVGDTSFNVFFKARNDRNCFEGQASEGWLDWTFDQASFDSFKQAGQGWCFNIFFSTIMGSGSSSEEL